MNKMILAFLITICALTPAFAQDLTIISENGNQNLFTSNDQLPYQQLIGYAIEVSSAALADGVGIGFHNCEDIYSMEGYSVLSKHPCELFVHSKNGPIVVRYQDVSGSMDKDIKKFLSENRLDTSLYYNKGRFRFELDEK